MLLVYRVMLELSLSHDAAGCFRCTRQTPQEIYFSFACAMLLVYRVMLELSLSHDAAGCFSFAGFPALSAEQMDPVRLACVRHAASVRPEPGSNPQIYI